MYGLRKSTHCKKPCRNNFKIDIKIQPTQCYELLSTNTKINPTISQTNNNINIQLIENKLIRVCPSNSINNEMICTMTTNEIGSSITYENTQNNLPEVDQFKKYVDNGCKKPDIATLNDKDFTIVSSIENIESGKDYKLDYNHDKKCVFVFETQSVANSLAQYPIVLTVGNKPCISLSVSGNDSGKIIRQFKLSGTSDIFRFEFPDGIKFKRFIIKQ